MPRFSLNPTHLPNSNKKVKALLLVAAMLCLPACADDSGFSTKVPETQTQGNTNALEGETVSLKNDIQKVISDGAFILGDDRVFGTQEILVIDSSNTLPKLTYKEGIEVYVSGVVEKFGLSELEEKHDLNLDPNLFKNYRGQPTIVARSIYLAPDPGDITANAQSYYNTTIAVEGEVDEVRSLDVFKLDEEKLFGARDLLVIKTPTTTGEIKKGDKVVAIGVLRPFSLAEFERDYDLTWDLSIQKELEAEYANQPVAIAREVVKIEE